MRASACPRRRSISPTAAVMPYFGGRTASAVQVTLLLVAIAVGQMALDFHCIVKHAADADEVGPLQAIQ
jgi:hypothetical protein